MSNITGSYSASVPKVGLGVILSTALVCCGGLVAVLGMLLAKGGRIDEQGLSMYAPVGYQEKVKSMLEIPPNKFQPNGQSGPLRYEPPDPNQPEYANQWGRLVFDGAIATPSQFRFYQQSNRLNKDIKDFNDNGAGFFEVDNKGAVWFRMYHHNFPLPYPERRRSQVMITLGGDPLPALMGEHVRFDFVPRAELSMVKAREVELVTAKDWLLTSGFKSHRAAALRLISPDTPVLSFSLTGDRVQMELMDSSFFTVYLNGTPVNLKNDATRAFLARAEKMAKGVPRIENAAPLEEGDRLRITERKTQKTVSLRFGKYAGGMATRNRIENGRQVTEIDPDLLKVFPWVGDLQTAIGRYVDSHPRPEEIGKPVIRLTLDSKLHSAISKEFLGAVRALNRPNAFRYPVLTQPACVCVLDALTGDVLAMPSYPDSDDMEEIRKRVQNRSLTHLTKGDLIRMAYNQNLMLIPIGSTMKPLFAASVWETHPKLRDLRVNENGSERSVLYGMKFSAFSTVARGMVGPGDFLRVSSNEYTINLGLLTLANNLQDCRGGTPSFVGGRADFSDNLSGIGNFHPTWEDNQGLFWPSKFKDCFGVLLKDGFGSREENLWEVGPLKPLLTQMKAENKLMYDAFSGVLPERTNLNLNKYVNFRGDFVSMMLGSGSNYWSNLWLTQAYARLGTGKMVEARLVVGPKDEVNFGKLPDLPVSKPVLNLIYSGMEKAVQSMPGSTAAGVAAVLNREKARLAGKGLTLRALGKTGTAMRRGARDTPDKIARECAHFCLYLELLKGGKVVAATSTSTYLQDRPISTRAVEMTGKFLPQIVSWMEEKAVLSGN